jgi:hypothetical protein
VIIAFSPAQCLKFTPGRREGKFCWTESLKTSPPRKFMAKAPKQPCSILGYPELTVAAGRRAKRRTTFSGLLPKRNRQFVVCRPRRQLKHSARQKHPKSSMPLPGKEGQPLPRSGLTPSGPHQILRGRPCPQLQHRGQRWPLLSRCLLGLVPTPVPRPHSRRGRRSPYCYEQASFLW